MRWAGQGAPHSAAPVLQVGQRRFVLLFLYMAIEGGGVVSGKAIMSAARRLRVTCARLRTACCACAVPAAAQHCAHRHAWLNGP